MVYAIRLLNFLNLLDAKGNLSITNILVVAMSIKILMMPVIDITAFVAFFTAVINYRFKSYQLIKQQNHS